MTKRLPSSSTLTWNFKFETFHYLYDSWNVDRAKQIIKERPRPIRRLSVEPFRELICLPGSARFGVIVNWRKVRSNAVSTDDPVITAYGSMGRLPIDGWHRIAKALLKGEKDVPWVGLTKEESKSDNVHSYDGPRKRPVRRRRARRRRVRRRRSAAK